MGIALGLDLRHSLSSGRKHVQFARSMRGRAGAYRCRSGEAPGNEPEFTSCTGALLVCRMPLDSSRCHSPHSETRFKDGGLWLSSLVEGRTGGGTRSDLVVA